MYFLSYEAGTLSRLTVYTISVYKISESLGVACGGKVGR